MRRRKLSDSGLTARQLIDNTPNYIIYNGDYVSIRRLRRVRDRATGDTVYEATTETNVLGERPRRHSQTISVLGGAERASDPRSRLRVDCDCEFHMYTCEVALYRHGAAEIKHSNGEFPYTTNPKGIPLVCKHVYVLLNKIVKTRG